jgi:hypothetical protein
VAVDGETHRLDRATAQSLRDALTDALVGREEYLHTAGEHRADGSYVVERRAADSAGHRKVFERFGELRTLFAELPREFTATDVDEDTATGGRRHLLVRHLAEHPAFDCELAARQPLTARKTTPNGGGATTSETATDSAVKPNSETATDGELTPADD